MKRVVSLILVFAILFSSFAYGEIFYSDTYDHWSAADVYYATNVLQLFNGYSDFTFKPDKDISRAEFVSILTRAGYKLGIITERYESDIKYKDLDFTKWYFTYVITFYEYMKVNAKTYGFYDVFTGDIFDGDKAITREEAIALIAIMCGAPIFDNKVTFTDIEPEYKYYKEICDLYSNGIVKGYEDNTFKPANNITRGESAALIRRVYDVVKSQKTKPVLEMKKASVKGDDILSFFGSYNFNTNDADEKKYIVAKNTLEQLNFYGYIFPEEKHLYDSDPIGTLKALREKGFANVVGVNYYLLRFGKLSDEEKILLSDEAIKDALKRYDLSDADLMQLYTQITSHACTENLLLKGLQKWHGETVNSNVKFNIKAFLYSYYLSINNVNMVKAYIYNSVNAADKYLEIFNINWELKPEGAYNFIDFTNNKLYFLVYKKEGFIPEENNPSNYSVSILKNIVLVDNPYVAMNLSNVKNETVYYLASMNRAYVLDKLGEYERAFAELLSDYKAVKRMGIYSTKKAELDNNYVSLLKYFKDKVN